jgi:DNA replication and repair protein RecF
MIVQSLHLRRFRNHRETSLDLGTQVNALVGNNGQGKTNVLEALSYLSLTKSFFGATDRTVLMLETPSFQVSGTVVDAGGRVHAVEIFYDRQLNQKTVSVNGVRAESMASVIGRFPVVVLAPEHAKITTGSPGERRRFIDLVLSQFSRAYLEELLEYRRVLRQRNRILGEARAEGRDPARSLEPWTESLAAYGARIVVRRMEFVGSFVPYVQHAHAAVAGGAELPTLLYASGAGTASGQTAEDVRLRMSEELRRRVGEERQRGMTLVGPHRDDLQFLLDGVQVQTYASQGQHKTLLVALKIAECLYLRERSEEPPALLLDDLFGELDPERSRRILEMVSGLGQTVITATDAGLFQDAVQWNNTNRCFVVSKGACRRVA